MHIHIAARALYRGVDEKMIGLMLKRMEHSAAGLMIGGFAGFAEVLTLMISKQEELAYGMLTIF